MAKDDALIEPDRLSGTPHPRDQYAFIGHRAGENAFIEGLTSGRLHHAWLIGGPQGIGKATLAYRVARYLLARGARAPQPGEGLAIGPEQGASKQVSALSHPNLVVLRRVASPEKKTVSSIIPVEVVRRGMSLFETTAADGGYRICIVDSAEDLNANSANALLKLVEEPPPQSIFLIVSHAPQRLLPTIRSRCRRLSLSPLADTEVRQVIEGLGEPFASAAPATLQAALAHGEGSVRKTLEMLDEGRATLIGRVHGLLDDLPRVDTKRVLALADTLAQRDAAPEFELAMECVESWISKKLHQSVAVPVANLARLVEVCDKLRQTIREVDIYNLDRKPLVLALFDDLAATLRSN